MVELVLVVVVLLASILPSHVALLPHVVDVMALVVNNVHMRPNVDLIRNAVIRLVLCVVDVKLPIVDRNLVLHLVQLLVDVILLVVGHNVVLDLVLVCVLYVILLVVDHDVALDVVPRP